MSFELRVAGCGLRAQAQEVIRFAPLLCCADNDFVGSIGGGSHSRVGGNPVAVQVV